MCLSEAVLFGDIEGSRGASGCQGGEWSGRGAQHDEGAGGAAGLDAGSPGAERRAA